MHSHISRTLLMLHEKVVIQLFFLTSSAKYSISPKGFLLIDIQTCIKQVGLCLRGMTVKRADLRTDHAHVVIESVLSVAIRLPIFHRLNTCHINVQTLQHEVFHYHCIL